MNHYGQALAIFDLCRSNGIRLELEGDRVRSKRPESGGVAPIVFDRLLDFLGSTSAPEARSGLDTHRALAAMVRAPSQAVRELLTLPVAAWHGLPLASTLTATRKGARFIATTSRAAFEASKDPAFVTLELEAAGLGVEEGRASGADLDRWIATKRRGQWRLTPAVVGVLDASRKCALTFGELFDGLGAELVAVEVHERRTASKGGGQ